MKKVLLITTIIMLGAICLALLKEKENNDYIMTIQSSTQLRYVKEDIKKIEEEIDEENSIKSKYEENNKEKVNELNLWKRQVEKIKSYL